MLWLRFVILAVMVIALPVGVKDITGLGQPWFCEWICSSGTILGGIPLTILNPFLCSAIGLRYAWKQDHPGAFLTDEAAFDRGFRGLIPVPIRYNR